MSAFWKPIRFLFLKNLTEIQFWVILLNFQMLLWNQNSISTNSATALCQEVSFQMWVVSTHPDPLTRQTRKAPCIRMGGMKDNFIFSIENWLFSIFLFLYMIYFDNETISDTILQNMNSVSRFKAAKSLMGRKHGTTKVQIFRYIQVSLWKIHPLSSGKLR